MTLGLLANEAVTQPQDPALVVMPFMGRGVGGSHMSGLALATGLEERFGLKTVILAPCDADVTPLAQKMGLETRDSGLAPKNKTYDPVRALLRFPGCYRLLRTFPRNSILHVNDMSSLPIWGPAARLLGMPVIYHDRANGRSFPKRYAIRLADHVITISDFCYENLPYLRADEKTLITDAFVYPSVKRDETLRRSLLAEIDAGPDCKLIGFSGNFWARKRPEFFLEAASEMVKRRGHVRFVMFGREGDVTLERLQSRSKALGLDGLCLFAGFRLPADDNIAALDLLMMPAIGEPFGRTPVEALLLGVPYVATDHAGHGEILQKWGGGIGVPLAASPKAFADIALQTLDRAEQTALSEVERLAVAEQISPASHAGAVMEVYRRNS